MTAQRGDAPASPQAQRMAKVRESLLWHEAFGVSKRHQRQARKWPWAWYCTVCDDAYGAQRTREEAQAAADEHDRTVHGWTEGER